jgi:ribonuclease J
MHMRAHAQLAGECQVPQQVLVENGKAVKFSDGRAKVMGTVWSGRMAFEDGEVMPFASQSLRDRKRMFYDGAAVATISLDEENEVVGEPQVAVLGMADPKDGDWGDTLHNALDRLPRKARRDDTAVEEAIRSAVRKTFAPRRKPVVKVHIQRV